MEDRDYTTEQLRKDIDSGRSGSKIAYPDPAAAPLGADDEAAGTPPSAAAVLEARRHEVENAPVTTKGNHRLDRGAYIYGGLLAGLIASLAAIAVWMSS